MKKLILAPLAFLLSSIICNAQLDAPVQADTLHITSMRYNFREISQGNWPFDVVIQNTTSFIIDGKEFTILNVEDLQDNGLHYSLANGDDTSVLIKIQNGENIRIEFSNYVLQCLDLQEYLF